MFWQKIHLWYIWQKCWHVPRTWMYHKQTTNLKKINEVGDFPQCCFFCSALAPDIDVFWIISDSMYPCASTAAPPDTKASNTSWVRLTNYSWDQQVNTLLQAEVGFYASAGVWKRPHPTGLGPDDRRGPHLVHHLRLHWYPSPDAVGGGPGVSKVGGLQSSVGKNNEGLIKAYMWSLWLFQLPGPLTRCLLSMTSPGFLEGIGPPNYRQGKQLLY